MEQKSEKDIAIIYTPNANKKTFFAKIKCAITGSKPVTYTHVNGPFVSHQLINPAGQSVALSFSDKGTPIYPPEAIDENGNLKDGWQMRPSLLE